MKSKPLIPKPCVIRNGSAILLAASLFFDVLLAMPASALDVIGPSGAIYTGVSANSEFNPDLAATKLFEIDVTGVPAGTRLFDLGSTDWARVGGAPGFVAFEVDQVYTVGSVFYAQREGSSPSADKITRMSVWASSTTPFTAADPGTPPDTIFNVTVSGGSIWSEYLLTNYITGRYFLIKAEQDPVVGGANNIGGNELRLGLANLSDPPAIITQPRYATNYADVGALQAFSVTASGSLPLHYQWYKSPNTEIPGATNSSYVIDPVETDSAGGYFAVVTNSLGSMTSQVASLTVVTVPTIITPVSATANSSYPGYGANSLVDGSGLSGTGFILNQTHNNDGNANGMWIMNATEAPVEGTTLIFDLGTQFDLTGADIWQMNQLNLTGRGVMDFSIYTSQSSEGGIDDFVGNFTLAQAGGTPTEPVQRLPFSATGVRRVKFVLSSTWSGEYYEYAGLSEVRFEGEGIAPPSIVTQPKSATNFVGTIQVFSATAAGTGPLSYQWYRSNPDTAIAGATNAFYTNNPVTIDSAGSYFVVVNNSGGSVTSAVVSLTVLPQPPIVTPVSATASSIYAPAHNPIQLINGNGLSGNGFILGQTHDNSVNGIGKWLINGAQDPVEGTTLIFDLGTQYNLAGADIWQFNQVGQPGRDVKDFGVFTSPNADGPITDFVGGFTLAQSGGAAEPVQRLTLSAAGVRRVMFVISNAWSGQVNEYAGLSEVRFEGTAPPAIVTQPRNALNYVGGSQTFSVAAIGTGPLRYQWYKSSLDTVIAAATNASYTISPVIMDDAGGYFAVVSNDYGAVTSMVATITVYGQAPSVISPNGLLYTDVSANSQYSGLEVTKLFDTDVTSLPLNSPLGVSNSEWAQGAPATNAFVAFALDRSYAIGALFYAQRETQNGNPVDKITQMRIWASDTTPFDPLNPPVLAADAVVPVSDLAAATWREYLLPNTVTGRYFLVEMSQNPPVGAYIGGSELRLGAFVSAPEPLRWSFSVSGLILIWDSGTLLQADDLNGPWTPAVGVTSGVPFNPAGARKFFRIEY